jgi:3-dehydroquinate dehydratase / shikimate dehydrogenase
MKNLMTTIQSERLILRPWEKEDLELFAKLNADPRVMEYFPSSKTFEESAQEYGRIVQHFAQHGWGLWAVSLFESSNFIGFIGLRYDDFPAPFTPVVEIGWRLAFDYWGKGYATEGAKAALKYGFEILNLNEIVSFTAVQNMRSRRIMEKIGMHHDPKDDFDHPKLPANHPLSRHVLYRIDHSTWRNM